MEFHVKLSNARDSVTFYSDDYIFIEINPLVHNKSFEELMSVEVINDIIRQDNKINEELADFGEDVILNDELSLDTDIINNTNGVSIELSDDMIEYVKNNPILANYKVTVSNEVKLNHEDYDIIKDTFNGYKDLMVNLEGNDEFISFKEYESALKAIDKIIEPIKKYDLSPFEQVMFAYDLVRDRVYTKESKGESPRLSRDLSKVLIGDKIVCAGFTEILAAVLDELGIKNDKYLIKNKNQFEAHIRNRIFIDDKKYRIHGLYHFDATYDSKKRDGDHFYTRSYANFAVPESLRMEYDGPNWEPFRTVVLSEELINKAREYISRAEKGDLDFEIYEFAPVMNQISDISRMLLDDNCFDRFKIAVYQNHFSTYALDNVNYNKLYKNLDKIAKLYNPKEVPLSTLTNLFIKVRQIENKEDPEKYTINSGQIVDMVSSTRSVNADTQLLYAIFGKGDEEKINRDRKIRKKVIDIVRAKNLNEFDNKEEEEIKRILSKNSKSKR